MRIKISELVEIIRDEIVNVMEGESFCYVAKRYECKNPCGDCKSKIIKKILKEKIGEKNKATQFQICPECGNIESIKNINVCSRCVYVYLRRAHEKNINN